MKDMKAGMRTTSVVSMVCIFILMGAVTAFVYRQMIDRITLISANDNERILNSLLAGLRDYENFGAAIEADVALTKRVRGIAVYLADGKSLYTWGSAPAMFDVDTIEKYRSGDSERYVIPDKKTASLKFLVRASRMSPMAPPERAKGFDPIAPTGAGSSGEIAISAQQARVFASVQAKVAFFFDTLRKGEWVYIDIRHNDYWRQLDAMNVVFPLVWLFLMALVAYMRSLILWNVEYRERIDKQKNLVVLGTAAGTLAHEIKNPLLAIRLQTGILEKTYPDSGIRELGIINSEIDRLSALTYRINDYLREPKGFPQSVDVAEFTREIALSMCGRDPVTERDAGDMTVSIDQNRFRSVLENVIRNALESGGSEASVEINLRRGDGKVRVDVLDRGCGISPSDAARLFEPFFTTKSRGTGIGLVICQRFVHAAGGSIRLSARAGGGMVVSVELPECASTRGKA